jgi:C1A family cysteine protease
MKADELRSAIDSREDVEWDVAEEAVEAESRLGYLPSEGVPPLEEQEALAAQAAAASPPPAPSYPPAVDLRATDRGSMVGPVRDQGSCGSCVAFGSCAAVEGTLRVERGEPGLEVDLSEAHLFYCAAAAQGRTCGGPTGGWFPKAALDVFAQQGVPDEACFPYTPGDQACASCTDWEARATRIAAWQPLHSPPEMKQWLANHGPIVGSMVVYQDFQYYAGGVYRHVSGNQLGGHCVCIVGYDDEAGYWICQNSWGGGWGEGGFFRIAYGECAIDSGALGVEGVRTPTPAAS